MHGACERTEGPASWAAQRGCLPVGRRSGVMFRSGAGHGHHNTLDPRGRVVHRMFGAGRALHIVVAVPVRTVAAADVVGCWVTPNPLDWRQLCWTWEQPMPSHELD